jgi:hypothetical protein
MSDRTPDPASGMKRSRQRSAPKQQRSNFPAAPFARREARLLARLKAVVKEIAASLPAHEVRHTVELFLLAFSPEPVPGVPAWAQKAARRVFRVDRDFPRPVPVRSPAEATAALMELQWQITAELAAEPALSGGLVGLTCRAVDDFAESAAESVARHRLEKLRKVCDAAKRLESDRMARLGRPKEAEFTTCLGGGMSVDSDQLIREANSYHDLDGIVAVRWREVQALPSRAEFRRFAVKILGGNAETTQTEKRLEHYCRLIGLSFRPPGRPKGSQNAPH